MTSQNVTRTAGKYKLELYLTDVLVENSRNNPIWFSQNLVVGVLDTIESPEILEGMGKKVDDLYKRLATEHNAFARQRGADSKLAWGGINAKISKVRYQATNGEVPCDSLELDFSEYVGMGRPRSLIGERMVVDTFRGFRSLDSI